MKHRILAFLLVLLLVMSVPMQAFAEDEEEEIQWEDITIRTAEELLSFAESCTLDSWSQNKRVRLLADISLEGMAFAPIATFGGEFDGNGHSITGIQITQSVAPAGLFGNVQKSGVVRKLRVQGTVTPGGDCAAIGGIVGENEGRVEECSFSGTVAGRRDTGGIAGSNLGFINGCKTDGEITGDNRTGGIAGYNQGEISNCENAMLVNTQSVDPVIDPTRLKFDFRLDFAKTSDLDLSDAASDTGGIAGYSSGSIRSSVNTGSIGYPHIGYNLGGIAGRSCGFVENCENRGTLTGRKDVGGIVGQIEPHIQTMLSQDYLETLSKQFENLGGLVNAAGHDGASAGGRIQDKIEALTGYQNDAKSALRSLVRSAGKEEFNKGALEDLGNSIRGMVNASSGLKNAIGDGVDTLSQDISAISGQISAISHTFALATEEAKREKVADLSDLDLTDIREGRVLKCVNTGTVEADLNVGGITGMMGLESTVDPEDDAPGGELTQRRRYELKAIVDSCENVGQVRGKRSYVGGICGRMALGLIIDSRGYGRLSSEHGDYVGGIAGLASGTVRNCIAKCTLSGGNYIGGIVGSGIEADIGGESSTVTGCYSMVEIEEAKQYIGAVSGGNSGVFFGNYFVSDTLAGINRVSYQDLAEPVSYEKMQTLQELPQSLREMTLRFVADGQSVKTLSFRYGDSFDSSVFPEIPQKEGCYARWSIRELENLRFDTVVEANYMPFITALNSADCRTGERPVFFVQGQFQEGDALTVSPGQTAYQPEENTVLLEQWQLVIPADGLQTHTIRFLPNRDAVQLLLLKSGSWTKIQPEEMGSYLAFEANGAEVELAVVQTEARERNWSDLAAILVAAALLILLIIFIVKKAKKKKKSGVVSWVLLAVLLLAACGAAVWYWCPSQEVIQSVRAYDVLKTYLDRPEKTLRLTVRAQVENKAADFTADIGITRVGDIPVSEIREDGRSLYYADGMVLLENGNAFRLNTAAPDYSALLGNMPELFQLVEIDAADGVYSITAEGEQAAVMTRLLLPSVQSLLPETGSLSVDLVTEGGVPTQIRFTGAGNLTDSVKTPFSLSAVVELLPGSDVVIPGKVLEVIQSGNANPVEVYSDDLIRLMEAWTQLRSRNPIAARIEVEGDVGPLTVSDALGYYAWRIGDTTIHGVERKDKMLYLTEDAACNAEGITVVRQTDEMDIGGLMEALYQGFKSARYQCRRDEGTYTVSLGGENVKQLVEVILPKAKNMEIHYEQGTIQLRLTDGQIESVWVTCGGNTQVGPLTAEVSLTVKMILEEGPSAPELPEAVKAALA